MSEEIKRALFTVDVRQGKPAMTPEEFEAFEQTFEDAMADIANKHIAEMQGMTEREAASYVKNIIDTATIAVGVYPDADEFNGIGLHIIKGNREMQVLVASEEAGKFLIDAIPCTELEQAVAAAEAFGDGKIKSDG
jgi:hypothetical protein